MWLIQWRFIPKRYNWEEVSVRIVRYIELREWGGGMIWVLNNLGLVEGGGDINRNVLSWCMRE